jgi:hypothetical protein
MHSIFIGFLLILLNLNILQAQCDEVLQLHRDKFEWMIEVQVDSLQKYFHEDAIYVHSNGWLETKAEVLNNLQSGHLKYDSLQYINATCRNVAETAIVLGEAIFFVRLDDKPIEIPLLYTEVYIKANGYWQFYSRHACRKTQ